MRNRDCKSQITEDTRNLLPVGVAMLQDGVTEYVSRLNINNGNAVCAGLSLIAAAVACQGMEEEVAGGHNKAVEC